jgi:hypothetical protein
MPRFFVSYVYEDKAYRDQIADWYRRGMLGSWEPVYETEDVRPGGWHAVQRHLSPLIQQSHALVVIVGNDTHNHNPIAYEVQNARSAGRAIVSVRIPNTYGAAPPSVPPPSVRFSPSDLVAALNDASR